MYDVSYAALKHPRGTTSTVKAAAQTAGGQQLHLQDSLSRGCPKGGSLIVSYEKVY